MGPFLMLCSVPLLLFGCSGALEGRAADRAAGEMLLAVGAVLMVLGVFLKRRTAGAQGRADVAPIGQVPGFEDTEPEPATVPARLSA